MNHLATEGKKASSLLHAGQGPGAARRPAEPEATHLCLFEAARGNMQRHNVLILSNLDTVEHLEIGISLISDTLLRQKKWDVYKLDLLCLAELCVCLRGDFK